MLTMDKQQPNELCQIFRPKTSNSNPAGVVDVQSGCACVVKTFRVGRVEFQADFLQTGHQSVKHAANRESPNNNLRPQDVKPIHWDIQIETKMFILTAVGTNNNK